MAATMFFDGDDKEGEFGPPPGKSKLSSLFGMDRANNQGGNESLTYTAPKQPKKGAKASKDGASPAASGGQSALLLAVAVHAYRFSNGTYIKHGKLGAAILGNHTANDYKLLLYISKQQQVTHARITQHFIFTTQANNYATFYDEQRQNWSIMFETEQNAIDFAKQVGLAKLNANGGSTKGVIQQDLTIGMGEPVSEGDSVEVKYTGWLFQNRAFGSVFDSNASVDKAFRFKIGRGKVIKGWEEGVISMKKGGRRLLLIPPSLAYGKKGLGSRIPANSTLIFDVEIKKIKVAKDETGSVSSDVMEAASLGAMEGQRAASPRVDGTSSEEEEERAPLPPKPTPPKTMKPSRKISSDETLKPRSPSTTSLTKTSKANRKISSDETVKTRTASLTEQLSTSPATTSKAKLISRMAKMGQPMLPLQGAAVATESTDDSEADENSASDTGYPSPPPVTAHPHTRSKPAKTVRKPPTGNKPEHQLPATADPIVVQQSGIQMPMQNSTGGMMAQTSQALPQTHTVAVYHPQQQQAQQPQQFQPQPQVQQQPMGMHSMQGMQKQTAFQSTNYQGMGQQYPYQQQYPAQTTDPNLLLQQQQAAAVAAAQQTLQQQQQQQFSTTMYPGTSQALVQQPPSQELPVLLSESRQHHTDIKMVMDLVSGKIDNLSARVEKLNFQSAGPGPVPSSVPNLEANILMQNIARIVTENEKLKKDNHEKSSKIESQNEKIAELIQRNQMFVEQSNTMLEKRNDSFKQTTAQSQARVLEMEQEKVQLTGDLSKATAKISSLQMELAALHQREGELKSQLNQGMNTSQTHLSEIETMRSKQQETDWKLTELTRNLKEEKAEKKTLSNRLIVLEDELNDLKTEKETIDKNLFERKRKATMEKQRFDNELEELKKQYEEEIRGLENKLRLQKSTKDIATAEQVAQIERDLEAQWRERSERLLAQAADKHERLYGDMNEEKESLSKKLMQTEHKMISLRSGQTEMREEADRLRNQLSEMSSWKEKYDGLHSNAVSMKERYEDRIKELVRDKESRDGAVSHSSIIDEVKKIMNSVYHTLRSEFEPGGNYKGADILNTIMNTIKLVTLKLVKRSAGGSTGDEEEEEEEEESEDEEEDDEDDEEEEDVSDEEAEEEEKPVQKITESVPQESAPVQEAAQASAPPTAPPSDQPTAPPSAPLPIEDEPEEIPDLPDVPAEPPQDEDSDKDEDGEEDDKGPSEEMGKQEVEEQVAEEVAPESQASPSEDHEEDLYGPSSLPPELPPDASPQEEPEDAQPEEPEDTPPESPPDMPDADEDADEEEEEVALDEKIPEPEDPAVDHSIQPEDNLNDLPDFSGPSDAREDEDAVPRHEPPSMSPPPFLPSLPPELPPEDEDRPKSKSAMDDIFGDDDDDEEEFFSTPPMKRKELPKKATPQPVKKKDSDEGDSIKSPPPLFGSDDDDDDLDWLSSKK